MVSNERERSEMVIVYGFSGGIDILNIKCTGPIKNRWQMEAAVRMKPHNSAKKHPCTADIGFTSKTTQTIRAIKQKHLPNYLTNRNKHMDVTH